MLGGENILLELTYKLTYYFEHIQARAGIKRKISAIVYLLSLRFVNLVMPLIYKCTFRRHHIKAKISPNDKRRIIVSLTSFPARIDHVWLCVESIFRQSVKPQMVILWLSERDFDGLNSLPSRLLRQQTKGLTIRFCDDLRSHTKYYYSFKEFPEDLIVTMDDDIFYPKETIQNLIKLHTRYPTSIACNRGHVIKLDKNDAVAPYEQWDTDSFVTNPSRVVCPTGVGGVLYPPQSVNEEVFNKYGIRNLCLLADDLWLKVMSLKNNTSVAKAESFPTKLFTIIPSQRESLAKVNIGQNKNDDQLKAVLDYYGIKLAQLLREAYLVKC